MIHQDFKATTVLVFYWDRNIVMQSFEYLPNILRPERHVSMFADLKLLEPVLKNPKSSNSWRTSSEYYRPVKNGLKPGSMNISPAWFEQGHEVLFN